MLGPRVQCSGRVYGGGGGSDRVHDLGLPVFGFMTSGFRFQGYKGFME